MINWKSPEERNAVKSKQQAEKLDRTIATVCIVLLAVYLTAAYFKGSLWSVL